MGRSYLAHRSGDANNAVLAAVVYNFRLLLNWLRLLWLQIWIALWADQGVIAGLQALLTVD